MKHISTFTLAAMLAVAGSASAQVPDGYYDNIDGKTATVLKSALKQTIETHRVFTYNELWETYEVTDVVTGTEDQIRDLYSDEEMYYTTRGTLINREHTVPQSWWGGGGIIDAYTDLINVLPSETKANGAKSNYPLGVVSSASIFDNGVTKVGPPTSSISGCPSSYVFEPDDRYKGDFARIYFYVATCYSDDSVWGNDAYAFENSDTTLKPWIIDMLLEWNNDDPVDEDELKRNEAVYYLQQNRNPFVDYPEMADYIWGDNSASAFNLSEHTANAPAEEYTFVFKAARPTYSATYGTDEDSAVAIEAGTQITVTSGNTGTGVSLFTKVGDEDWNEWTSSDAYATATLTINEECRVQAYCTFVERDAASDIISAYFTIADNSAYLLYEDFSTVGDGDNISTSNNATSWDGNDNFPTVSSAFQAGGALRLGASKKVGSITSKELNFDGGTLYVDVDVKGWTSVEGKLTVTVDGAASQTLTYTATLSDDFETFSCEFTEVSANPTVTIATTAKRAFIDNVKVYTADTTGIADIINTESSDTTIYRIDGVQMRTTNINSLPKGIYIVNGKKVFATK